MDFDTVVDTLMLQPKLELVRRAREAGWSGDDARTEKLIFAQWLAHRQVGATPEPRFGSPVPSALTPPANMQATIAAALAGALAGMKFGVDEDAVRTLIDQRLAQLQPARIVVTPAGEVRIDEATHPVFEKVLRLVQAGLNVMLVGPAGCGKSYLAKQVAKALNRDFGTLHCSAGVSESHVTGWLIPVGDNGKFEFVPAQFARLYSQGNSVFLIDEMDAADPNMLTILNGATANGALHIPQDPNRPEWKRGENAAIIAACNTFGQGADMLYVGRNQLDAATLDRFYVVSMDYDPRLEHQIAGLPYSPAKGWEPAPAPTPQELQELSQWVLDLRAKAVTAKLRRVVSTRTLQKAVAARGAGIPTEEVKRDLLAGWSKDELAKVQA